MSNSDRKKRQRSNPPPLYSILTIALYAILTLAFFYRALYSYPRFLLTLAFFFLFRILFSVCSHSYAVSYIRHFFVHFPESISHLRVKYPCMKKIPVVLLALICIAGLGTGFAGADTLEPDVIEDETMLIMPILGTALPLPVELVTVYHPLSMLITDTEADKLQALADMVWLPAGDEAPAGFYYPKVLSIPTVPDGVSPFSAF